MNKEFILYEQSVALKELGFDEPCFGSYVKLTETQNTFFMNDVVSEIDRETPLHKSLITKAPLYQQAFRWFREKHNLHHVVIWDSETNNFDAGLFGELPFFEEDTIFTTYEEAEQACLDKLIELVKNKTNENFHPKVFYI